MTGTMQASQECCAGTAETPSLEDLIPIAVVIAAGCERCTERMVGRALERGSAKTQIAATLDIVVRLRALDCFARAVGPEVIERMERPLQAGNRALGGVPVGAQDRERRE